ncbi:hypothetical protein ROZALSC1DRAFT_25802 [Rozella allomycis CSF55]|uniref:Uncharacterized protein n=1 Tax=Rozella allomycis (strain CSF55) TaxID=988480 RepID=A0A4P9YAW2_ROZAC|nr:hypothetical protein ROZALSC1DRAFT_25802 [Rozella allomycis CSF55]
MFEGNEVSIAECWSLMSGQHTLIYVSSEKLTKGDVLSMRDIGDFYEKTHYNSKVRICDRGVFNVKTWEADERDVVLWAGNQYQDFALAHFGDYFTYHHMDMGHSFAWFLPIKVKVAIIWLFWKQITKFNTQFSSYTCDDSELLAF